jgi:heat shock protein HtpX
MAIALLPIAAIYLLVGALAVALFAAAAADGDVVTFVFGLFLTVGGAIAAYLHVGRIDELALRAARARVLDPDDDEHRSLHVLVARVAATADLPPPRVALIRSWAPNAFATGLKPERAVIALTTELLRRLEARDLEAVVAHEVAHIANRDGMVMTFVAGPAMAGSAMWNAEDWRGKILFVYYLPIYVVGLLLMWTISRYREYAADRGAAILSGSPEQLMSALQKIGGGEPRGDLRGGAAVSALCIVPAQRKGRLSWLRRFEIFMDHPSLEKRLRRLSELSREIGEPLAS